MNNETQPLIPSITGRNTVYFNTDTEGEIALMNNDGMTYNGVLVDAVDEDLRDSIKAMEARKDTTRLGWMDAGKQLPESGEWVLHTYYGVRRPEYGLFKKGRFFRDGGPESFPTTHWMRVPLIPEPIKSDA